MTESTPPNPAENSPLVLRLLKALLASWQAAAIYEENNNAYRMRRAELQDSLRVLFDSGADCLITFQGGFFFFNGTRLKYDHAFTFGRTMAARFANLRLGELNILQTAPETAVDQALFALAHTDSKESDPFSALAQTWRELNIPGVAIGPILDVEQDVFDPANLTEASRRQRAQALFGRAESVVQDMWKRVRDRNSFDASTTQRVIHQLIDQIAQDEGTLLEFTALKEFDEYTYYHSVNVAIYSIAVGMRLGLDRSRLTSLGMAALFHDIGKVKLPYDLITKPDEYDEDDWVQIRRHPALGALTLANMRRIDAEIAVAMAGAFEHHLRMDMTGYPKLSRPRKLHLYSRIIALCDAFDAMTSGRVYQKEWTSPDEAIRRLVYKGREWFDTVVLKAFVHVLGIFPVGTVARLSDQSIAVVICNNPDDPYAPEVTVVREPDGAACVRPLTLARRDTPGTTENLYITAILDPTKEGISIGDYLASIPDAEEVGIDVT